MFKISPERIITMNRGDSFEIPLFINCGTKIDPLRYSLKSTDKVFFAVMEPNQPFETALVRKVFDITNVNENGDIVIEFITDDTVNLLPGEYYYEIKIRFDENHINTIVDRHKFIIQ